MNHETDLSTEQSQKIQKSRVSQTHVHQGRASGDQPSPRQGPCSPGWLTAGGRVPARRGYSKNKNITVSYGVAALSRRTFEKADRILKRSDFVSLTRHGRRLQNDVFIALVLPGQTDRSRLGITVTRRVGRAVERNRIKRLVREFFRRRRSELNGNHDINIIAKQKAATLPSDHIFSALQSLFDQIKRRLERDDHRPKSER